MCWSPAPSRRYQDGDEANPFVITSQGAVLGAMALVVAKPRPVTVKAIDNGRDAVRAALGVHEAGATSIRTSRRAPPTASGRDLSGYLGAIERVKPKIGQQQRLI